MPESSPDGFLSRLCQAPKATNNHTTSLGHELPPLPNRFVSHPHQPSAPSAHPSTCDVCPASVCQPAENGLRVFSSSITAARKLVEHSAHATRPGCAVVTPFSYPGTAARRLFPRPPSVTLLSTHHTATMHLRSIRSDENRNDETSSSARLRLGPLTREARVCQVSREEFEARKIGAAAAESAGAAGPSLWR